MIGYEYGNTRLRVRASRLLDADDYLALLGSGSLDGVLGNLARGPYAREVESALARHTGFRRIDDAVRTHLSSQLADVLTFYAGEIRDRLQLYETRWDVRNVRTVLRSLAQRSRGESPTSLLVAAGNLDAASVTELAAQPDVRSAVDLLSLWQVPSPTVIRHLRRAMPAFSQTGDVLLLEQALDQAFGDMVASATADLSHEDPVVALLQQEIDQINLTTSLRWRDSNREAPAGEPFAPLTGGSIRESVWVDIAEFEAREDIATRLLAHLPAPWRRPLTTWAELGNTTTLENDLEAAMAQASVTRFRRGDPLGMDIPLGFIGRQEAEAKNIRLIGRAVAEDLPREEVFGQLLGVS